MKKQNAKSLYKKFVKSRKVGKQTIDEFCKKNKVTRNNLFYLIQSNGFKYPRTNRKHTAETIRQTARKFEKFMENPKHKVIDFFKSTSELTQFYNTAKKFGIEIHHRSSKRRRRPEPVEAVQQSSYTPSPVLKTQPKKRGLFSLLSKN
jgi:phage antirepressor YoqD-like protein